MHRLALASMVVALLAAGCEDHSIYFRHEPSAHEWGTFGEELYRVLLAAARSSGEDGQPRGRALAERRDPVVEALDLTLPPELYEPAEAGLAATLSRVDDGTLPRLTRQAAELLGRVAEDGETLEAMTDLRDEPWTASRVELYDLARHAAGARDGEGDAVAAPFLASLLRLAREHDGRGDDGTPSLDEPAQVRELLRALSLDLEALDLDDASGAHVLGDSLPERLLAELGIPDEGGPLWVVQADPRGLPRVRIDSRRGTVYAPFVDADGDRLADVDQDGDFVDVSGASVEIPPYGHDDRHASDGRALAEDGQPLYEYANFSRSAAGVALRGARQMVRDGANDELGERLETLLGPRTSMQDPRDGAWYRGFSPDRIGSTDPAFDLLWALLEAIREVPPDRLLRGAEALVRERRSEVLDVLREGMEAVDVVDEVGLGELAEANSLLDDLLVEEWPPGAVCYGPSDADFDHTCLEPPGPLLPRLIDSGVLGDLMDVLSDERLAYLAEAMATLMRYRDRISESDMRFDEPVDHAGPETEVNRSAFQRLMHLVHDSNDAHFDTWLSSIGLSEWRVDNLAVYYLQTYCGEATLPSGLDVFLPEFSSDRPTTSEMSRFINHDQSGFPVFENPVGREGRELWTYNADTLLAVEASGMQQALQPVVEVFCAHGELLLLANLFSVLHEHFSSLPRYTTEMTATHDFYGIERPAELRSVEGGLSEALVRTDLIEAVLRVGVAGTEVTVDGEPIVDELIAFLDHLIDPDATVYLRTHAEPGRDTIYRYDRLEPASRPTHANVVYQRAAELGDVWNAEDPTVRGELTAISDLLSDYYLDLPEEGEGRAAEAEYLVHMAERSLPVLAEWVEANLDRGSWSDHVVEARRDVDDLEEQVDDLLSGPLMPALVDVVTLVRDDEEAKALFRDLALHLLSRERGEAGDTAPLEAVARVLAAAVQIAPARGDLERVGRFLGSILDPAASPVVDAAGDLALLTGASPESVALAAAVASLAGSVRAGDGRPPLVVLAEALAAMGRSEPGAEGSLSAEDLATLLGHAVRLLTDTSRGLERIYAIVGERVREE